MKQLNKLSSRSGVSADHATQRLKRLKKTCLGCADYFTTYQLNNYDYCRNCAINGHRCRQKLCPECGDGSGWIKFPQQPIRACKLCSLQPHIVQKELKHA